MTKRGVWWGGHGIGRLMGGGGIECSRIGTTGSTTGSSQLLLAMLPNLRVYPHPSLMPEDDCARDWRMLSAMPRPHKPHAMILMTNVVSSHAQLQLHNHSNSCWLGIHPLAPLGIGACARRWWPGCPRVGPFGVALFDADQCYYVL